jgi:hypothetical protein
LLKKIVSDSYKAAFTYFQKIKNDSLSEESISSLFNLMPNLFILSDNEKALDLVDSMVELITRNNAVDNRIALVKDELSMIRIFGHDPGRDYHQWLNTSKPKLHIKYFE